MARKVIRYLGLDFGNSSSQVCVTTAGGEGVYHEPRPVVVKGQSRISSLVLLDQNQAQAAIAVGTETYQGGRFSAGSLSLQQEIKTGLLQDNPEAEKCLAYLAQVFANDLKETFSVDQLASDAFVTAIGWPVAWEKDKIVANKIKAGLEPAGFTTSKGSDEPRAALYYSVYRDWVKFYRGQSKRVLIIDLAGTDTRLSIFEQVDSDAPKLIKNQVIAWGGDALDWRLLNGWFLPQYWAGKNTLTDWQRQVLRFWVRDLKEIFSEHVKRGDQRASADFRELGLPKRVELSREQFESSDVAGSSIFSLEAFFSEARKDPLFAQVDQILLIGGSANWYFVPAIVQKVWPGSTVSILDEPELAVAKGLALIAAGYKPVISEQVIEAVMEPDVVIEIGDYSGATISAPPPTPRPDPTATLRKQKRILAEKQVRPYILWGCVVAAVLAPIPGLAPVVLIAMEIWMTYQISKTYGANLNGSMIILTGVLLLAMSIGLKTAVEFVLTIFYILCFLKPLVAGIVIWGLGQGAIWFFDRIVYEGGFEALW